MNKEKNKINFEVLIDESFLTAWPDVVDTYYSNKNILSMVNKFQDGLWWDANFDNFIWDNLKETALSAKERNALIDMPSTMLQEASKNLRFTDSSKDPSEGSEIAEILLYGIMKTHFGALPATPKIFYKQNHQDTVKGADSVHIIIENENDFSIWLGEAKFFNSIDDNRLSSIITSIEDLLKTEKIKKENRIITGLSDIDVMIADQQNLLKKIRASLETTNSIDDLKARLNIPILILHECEITNSNLELSEEYKRDIKQMHLDRSKSYFKKQIKKLSKSVHKYSEIKFHIILFPVPNKKTIVERFLKDANFYKHK